MRQVVFSPDGNFLYTGARQDDLIHCWDVRATGQVLYSLPRCTGSTNQRIGFSIEPCGRHLATGGCDGAVRVSAETLCCINKPDDDTNGNLFGWCSSQGRPTAGCFPAVEAKLYASLTCKPVHVDFFPLPFSISYRRVHGDTPTHCLL